MTPKEIEDIRSWRRGEWVADITEIESMVYGLVDELDRLRAAAETLAGEIDDSLTAEGMDGWSEAERAILDRGRELGLWD